MKNKKNAFLISLLAIILFLGVTVFFFRTSIGHKIVDKIHSEKGFCDYRNDHDAYLDFIAKKDGNICACLTDQKMREECYSLFPELQKYNDIFYTDDIRTCDNITDEDMRYSCQSVFYSRERHLQEIYEEDRVMLEKIPAEKINIIDNTD